MLCEVMAELSLWVFALHTFTHTFSPQDTQPHNVSMSWRRYGSICFRESLMRRNMKHNWNYFSASSSGTINFRRCAWEIEKFVVLWWQHSISIAKVSVNAHKHQGRPYNYPFANTLQEKHWTDIAKKILFASTQSCNVSDLFAHAYFIRHNYRVCGRRIARI